MVLCAEPVVGAGGHCRFPWLCVSGAIPVVVWSVLVFAVVFPGFVFQV